MNRALVLQHIRCEPPGLFSGMLDDRGALVETIELDEGGELPDWREADLVVAMGGPMSVRDEIEHPRLAGEKRWIAATVRVGVPYFRCLPRRPAARGQLGCAGLHRRYRFRDLGRRVRRGAGFYGTVRGA